MNYSMTFAKALQKAYRGGPPTCGYGPVFADLVESGFDGIEGGVFGDRIAAYPSFLGEPGGHRFAITRRELAIVNGTIMRCVLERSKVIPLWLVYPLQRPTIQALTPKESVYDLINH